MKIISKIDEFRFWRSKISGSLGFVPTMGALHKGHFSLIEESNKLCDHTVVSIYVNPTQFAPQEDFDEYPKNIDNDINGLTFFNVDAILIPSDSEIYPQGFKSNVNVVSITIILEGKSRPHFFQGVTTIVSKLFNIINPHYAFFGEKDAQQLRVIKKMVEDLNYSINIISCPTIREKNGLAMSSRNKYLSKDEFSSASIIYSSLKMAEKLLIDGEKNPNYIRNKIKKFISQNNTVLIDYISISDNLTLEEINSDIKKDVLISIAVYIGKIRLIDNFSYLVPK